MKQVETTPKKWIPKNWTIGLTPNVIVDDCLPFDALSRSDAVGYYGGYLIAESVAPSNQTLIAAAPDMLEALKHLEGSDVPMPHYARWLVKSAIDKAEGREA